MAEPEIAVLVSTFERPHHLRRVLLSLAAQQGVSGKFEVIVTDDGSRDETPELVLRLAREVPYPLGYTTHPHEGFRLARCRNEGVAASQAPYLLFLDGDCLVPPDHVQVHLERRRSGVVHAGYCAHLDETTSAAISDEEIAEGSFTSRASLAERWKLVQLDLLSRWYSYLQHPEKPKLFGGNIGIHRDDYLRVNGYDENFVGWGCEDDDLRLRLRRIGVRIESILWWTCTYHLWHPRVPSAPVTWKEGANVPYLLRPIRLTRCVRGLESRDLADLEIRLAGTSLGSRERQVIASWGGRIAVQERSGVCDIEALFASQHGPRFSGDADCNLLIVADPEQVTTAQLADAHLIASDAPVLPRFEDKRVSWGEVESSLRTLLFPGAAPAPAEESSFSPTIPFRQTRPAA